MAVQFEGLPILCTVCYISAPNIPLKHCDTYTVQKSIGRASTNVCFVDCWPGSFMLKNRSYSGLEVGVE